MVGFKDNGHDSKTRLDDYLDSWVRFSKHNDVIIGYLKGIDNNEVALQPYTKMDYTDKGQRIYMIEKDDSIQIPRNIIGPYEGSSEQSAENFCKYMNKKFNLENLRDSKEQLDHMKEVQRLKKKRIIPAKKMEDLDNIK